MADRDVQPRPAVAHDLDHASERVDRFGALFCGRLGQDGPDHWQGGDGVRVASARGHNPTWGEAIVRYFGYLLSGAALSLGFIWISLDSKRQGWHDKMANTYVVSVDEKFADAGAVKITPSDPGHGWWWIFLWIAVALLAPAALFAGLWFLGPVVAESVESLIRGWAQ
ncbi:MAG: RDD family protein [Caldilineaceae bacterium]|nr:RDD family protein [Caldilineaceae bacterium]